MKLNEGTPKSIDEVIELALMMGPLPETAERLRAAFRDYLSQKFTAAYMLAESEDEIKRLRNLWTLITGEVSNE